MCAMAFLGPGQNLVMATPGFDVMAHYAQAAASRVQAVPLNNYGARPASNGATL